MVADQLNHICQLVPVCTVSNNGSLGMSAFEMVQSALHDPSRLITGHPQTLHGSLFLYSVFLSTLFLLLLDCTSWHCKVSLKWLFIYDTLKLTNLHYVTWSVWQCLGLMVVTTLTECQCIVIGNVCALHVSEVPEKSVLVSLSSTLHIRVPCLLTVKR